MFLHSQCSKHSLQRVSPSYSTTIPRLSVCVREHAFLEVLYRTLHVQGRTEPLQNSCDSTISVCSRVCASVGDDDLAFPKAPRTPSLQKFGRSLTSTVVLWSYLLISYHPKTLPCWRLPKPTSPFAHDETRNVWNQDLLQGQKDTRTAEDTVVKDSS